MTRDVKGCMMRGGLAACVRDFIVGRVCGPLWHLLCDGDTLQVCCWQVSYNKLPRPAWWPLDRCERTTLRMCAARLIHVSAAELTLQTWPVTKDCCAQVGPLRLGPSR